MAPGNVGDCQRGDVSVEGEVGGVEGEEWGGGGQFAEDYKYQATDEYVSNVLVGFFWVEMWVVGE